MSINRPEKDPEWERLECLIHFEQAHKLRIEKLMSWWSFQLSHRTINLRDSYRVMIFRLLELAFFITTAFSIPYLSIEKQRWQTIFVFLTTNYIAHAITTIAVPGAKWKRHLFFSFRALLLLLPNIGLIGAMGSVICEDDQVILPSTGAECTGHSCQNKINTSVVAKTQNMSRLSEVTVLTVV